MINSQLVSYTCALTLFMCCSSDFEAKKDKRDVAPKRLTRSLSNNDAEEEPVSGDAVSASEAQSAVTSNTSRRKSFGIKALIGLSRKSRSSSQLAGGTGNSLYNFSFFLLAMFSLYNFC